MSKMLIFKARRQDLSTMPSFPSLNEPKRSSFEVKEKLPALRIIRNWMPIFSVCVLDLRLVKANGWLNVKDYDSLVKSKSNDSSFKSKEAKFKQFRMPVVEKK